MGAHVLAFYVCLLVTFVIRVVTVIYNVHFLFSLKHMLKLIKAIKRILSRILLIYITIQQTNIGNYI